MLNAFVTCLPGLAMSQHFHLPVGLVTLKFYLPAKKCTCPKIKLVLKWTWFSAETIKTNKSTKADFWAMQVWLQPWKYQTEHELLMPRWLDPITYLTESTSGKPVICSNVLRHFPLWELDLHAIGCSGFFLLSITCVQQPKSLVLVN